MSEIVAYVDRLQYRDATGVLLDLNDSRVVEVQAGIVEEQERIMEATEETALEHPDWFGAMDRDARQFMATLGFTGLRPFVLLPEDEDALEYFDITGSTFAITDNRWPFIVARISMLEELRTSSEREVAQVLVHELAHSAVPDDYVTIQFNDDDAQQLILHDRSGFYVGRDNLERGIFLEEGFAHFISGWYRRSRGAHQIQAIGITDLPGKETPDYLKVAGATMAGIDGYAIELLAWGIQRKGIMSANDFIATLLETRSLDTKLRALRLVAQAINGLQPGLYNRLQTLDYGSEDWQKGLTMAYQAAHDADA